jgi:hypothetical protein
MSEQFTNFGSTTLNGAINNSITTVVVTDGSVFPATGDFHIIVDNEIMLVTARSTNSLSVTRGQESTAGASHSDLATVKLVLSATALTNYFGDRVLIGGYASIPRAQAGQIYYANDINLAWWSNGSNWDLIKPTYVPYANRTDVSGWTSFNIGTSTWNDFNGVGSFQVQTGTGGDNLRGYYHNIPSAPFKANCIIRTLPNDEQFNLQGLTLSDATKHYTISVMGASSQANISVDKYNSTTSFNANNYRQCIIEAPCLWLRINDDNTNWLFQYSYDGKNYITAFSVARNTFLTATKVGMFVDRVETTYPSTAEYGFLAYWEN